MQINLPEGVVALLGILAGVLILCAGIYVGEALYRLFGGG
ncbi:hypothetical protein GCM10007392_26910 [Saccharospirillum salsuginis]|uniref:Uncharacterized protein n=1 Tax=Saccharospirillum salsuginis TaxID=418750 RepID=A0A918NBA4_9GAMM|nr:hypothetical protein GCM10007392_26910 [Saccharospirillum salsuginis]